MGQGRRRALGIGAGLGLGAAAAAGLVRLWEHLDASLDPDLRVGLCAALAAAALAVSSARLMRSRAARIAAGVGLVALLGALVHDEADRYLARLGTPQQVRAWSVFHYYLGSKYFAELGFQGLYPEALKADFQGERRLGEVRRWRSMESYDFVDADEVRTEPRAPAWSDARWREFQRDLASIRTLRSDWQGPFRDRGYNPSPVWTAFGSLLTGSLSIGDVRSQTLLVLLDPLLLLLAFAFSTRAYGWLRSLLVLAGIVAWYGNENVLFGAIYQYDWLAACWAALSAARLGWLGVAGVFVAYAASVRIFPGVLLVGPVLAAAWSGLDARRIPAQTLRMAGCAAAAFAVLLVFAAIRTERGFDVYPEFATSLQRHLSEHILGKGRVGLGHLFLLDWADGLPGTLDRSHHRAQLEANGLALRLCQLGFLGLFAWACRRRGVHDAMLLGLAVFFAGTVGSRYYASAHALVLLFGAPALVGPGRSEAVERPWRLRAFDAAFFALVACVYAVATRGEDRMERYLFGNALLTLFYGSWLVCRVAERRNGSPGSARDGRLPAPG